MTIVHDRNRHDDAKRWSVAQLPEAEAAFIAVDPDNGAIRALVGGFDFHRNKFNHTTQSWRQPGSAFKPFVYAAALEAGYSPASMIENLTSGARSIALAELGSREKRNATEVVGNVAAMTAALELAQRLNADAILAMHAALVGDAGVPPDAARRFHASLPPGRHDGAGYFVVVPADVRGRGAHRPPRGSLVGLPARRRCA